MLAFVLFGCAMGLAFGAEEVVLSIVLHRHGDRSPVVCLPVDDACASHFPAGFGQLSGEGAWMGHRLGHALRARYGEGGFGLVRTNYTRRDVVMRSTDYDRTLMTVTSVGEGLFPPGTGPNRAQVDGGGPGLTHLRLQPLPIHTVPQTEDWLLRSWVGSTCPEFAEAGKAEMKTQKKLWDAQEAKLDAIRHDFGTAIGVDPDSLTVGGIYVWTDALLVYKDNGFAWPPKMTEELYYAANNISEFSMTHLFATKQQQKLSAGPLLHEWDERIQAAIQHKPQPGFDPSSFPPDDHTPGTQTGPRVAIYSAHDATIVSVLQALQCYNHIHPPYTSSVVIELLNSTSTTSTSTSPTHHLRSSPYSVRVWYNMGSEKQAMWQTPVSPPGCAEGVCSMQAWKDAVERVRLTAQEAPFACGAEKKCDAPSAPGDTKWDAKEIGVTVGSSVAALFVGAAIATAFLCLTRRSTSSSASSSLLMDSHGTEDWDSHQTSAPGGGFGTVGGFDLGEESG